VSVFRLLPARERPAVLRVVEDERLLGRIRELHAANYYAYGYRRMWKRGAPASSTALPRATADALGWHPGAKRRDKPWRTTKPDPPLAGGPISSTRLHGTQPDELWRRDLVLPALLGRARLLPRFVIGRVQPQDRRLAARDAHAHRSRPSDAPQDGARSRTPAPMSS